MPAALQKLIREMAIDNTTWGEERIADELLLKIGIRISPRTVRRYMAKNPNRPADPKQRWMTFVRNHAKAVIATDFLVVVRPRSSWFTCSSSWKLTPDASFTST
jgi:hypothetical protein